MIEGTPSAVSILLETVDRDNKQIRSLEERLKAITEDRVQSGERLEEMSRLVDVERQRVQNAEDIIEMMRSRLVRFAREAQRVAKFLGWNDRTRFSDRASVEARVSDMAESILGGEHLDQPAQPAPMTAAAQDKHTPDDLKNGELYVFRQLLGGLVWDGNIASKNCRDSLREKGLIYRVEGWNFLSKEGVKLAVESGELKS